MSEEHEIHVYIPILRTQGLCNNAHNSKCNGQWLEEGNLDGEEILYGEKKSHETLKKGRT